MVLAVDMDHDLHAAAVSRLLMRYRGLHAAGTRHGLAGTRSVEAGTRSIEAGICPDSAGVRFGEAGTSPDAGGTFLAVGCVGWPPPTHQSLQLESDQLVSIARVQSMAQCSFMWGVFWTLLALFLLCSCYILQPLVRNT